MPIPSLQDALNVLSQRTEQQAKLAEDNLIATDVSQKHIIDASEQLDAAILEQQAAARQEARDTQIAEARLTGGVQGQRLIERLQNRLYLAAEMQLNLQEEEANRGGVEKLWDNVIRHGTGSTPGERVVAQLDQEKARIQGTLATLKDSAASAISLYKTAYNSRADELSAITQGAALKQQGAGVRADAESKILNARTQAGDAKTNAANTNVQARLQLDQAARQARLDRMGEIELDLRIKEMQRVKSSAAEKAIADAALTKFIASETGLSDFQIASMPDAVKTQTGIILQAAKDGLKFDQALFEKNPDLRALVFRQQQKLTPINLGAYLPEIEKYNMLGVQEKGKLGVETKPLNATTQNLFSFSSPPKFVDEKGEPVVSDAYGKLIAPVLDNIMFGEDPTRNKGVDPTQAQVVMSNPEVQRAANTPIGKYWLTQIVPNGGTDEGLMEEARKYPSGFKDLYELKAALARSAAKFIPANIVGHEVEPTIAVTKYEMNTSFWSGEISMVPKVVRISVGMEGELKFMELQKANQLIEQQVQRSIEAKKILGSNLNVGVL